MPNKSNAQYQADYRERMRATHARVVIYIPRPTLALASERCMALGIPMSEYTSQALEFYSRRRK